MYLHKVKIPNNCLIKEYLVFRKTEKLTTKYINFQNYNQSILSRSDVQGSSAPRMQAAFPQWIEVLILSIKNSNNRRSVVTS